MNKLIIYTLGVITGMFFYRLIRSLKSHPSNSLSQVTETPYWEGECNIANGALYLDEGFE